MKDDIDAIVPVAIGTFLVGFCAGAILLMYLADKKYTNTSLVKHAVGYVVCPGADPIVLDNWKISGGKITGTLMDDFVVVPDNCWLVASGEKGKEKVASK